MIMHGAEPFLLPGGPHGVLLIHGFTGMPAELLLLGEYLQKQGFTVLCPRLAGHGTSPQDMAKTGADDWFDSVCDGYAMLAGCVQTISVAGLSMGGLLALLLAVRYKVDKVVSLASPVFIAKESGIAALPPREECGGLFAPKGRRHMKDVPAICNLTYHCLPVGCVYELLDVIEAVKRQLPEVKVPLLVMQGERDHTVQIKSARYIYERAGTERKSLIWLKDSGHLIPLDADREEAFRDITLFLQDKL